MNPLRALFLGISRMPPAVMLATIIGLAVGVTFLVTERLKVQEADYRIKTDEMTRKMSEKTTVVYAIKDIPEGQSIPSEALEERQIEKSKTPPDALAASTLAAGRVSKYGISQGQMVSQHDLQPVQMAMGFESRLRPGMRAVTFAVDNNTGVAGFIAPESHVDVISMVGSGSDTKAKPILSDVNVIAVGQTYQRATGNGQATPASSITVEVSPDDAQQLIKGVIASKLYLSLRNSKDHTPVATVDVNSLFAKPPVQKSDVAQMIVPPLPPTIGGPSDMSQPNVINGGSTIPVPVPLHEVETWSGAKKDVLSVPMS